MNKVFFLLVVPVLLCFYSCASKSADENMNNLASEPVMSKDDAGGAAMAYMEINELPEQLSEEQKEAFELRAIQKLEDFIGYLKIISDRKVDKKLVSHTVTQANELFVSDTITIQDSLINDGSPTLISNYLNALEKNANPLTISIGQSCFTTHLNTETYRGTIETHLLIKTKELVKYVDVYLVEISKDFGGEQQKAVEVRLGNIY